MNELPNFEVTVEIDGFGPVWVVMKCIKNFTDVFDFPYAD